MKKYIKFLVKAKTLDWRVKMNYSTIGTPTGNDEPKYKTILKNIWEWVKLLGIVLIFLAGLLAMYLKG